MLAVLMHWPPGLDKEQQYNTLAYGVMILGTVCSVVFYIGTAETPPPPPRQRHNGERLRRLSTAAGGRAPNGVGSDHHAAAMATAHGAMTSSSASADAYQRLSDHASPSYDASAMQDEDDVEAAAFPTGEHGVNGDGGEDCLPPLTQSLSMGLGTSSPAVVPRTSSSSYAYGGMALEGANSSTSGSSSTNPVSDASEYENTLLLHLASLPVRFTSYKSWLQQREFWVACFIYMCARIVVNVSQVFISFYVLDALKLENLYITILPATLYVSSLGAASAMQGISKRFGRKIVFSAGFGLASSGLIGLFFLPAHPSPYCWLVFPCCVFIGVGNSSIMVCCTQLTSDLIGSRTNYAAFVFGSFSFTDKLACGAIIALLQSLYDDSSWYVRCAVTLPPIIAAIVAVGVLVSQVDLEMWKKKHHLTENAARDVAKGIRPTRNNNNSNSAQTRATIAESGSNSDEEEKADTTNSQQESEVAGYA